MMRTTKCVLMVALAVAACTAFAKDAQYQPTWESVESRPLPGWYDHYKFGIFIHWGLYSVPSWGPKGRYSEWYWHDMQDKNGETWKFHEATYGADFTYQDFAPLFKAEMYNPKDWASVFKRSGAKYVVLTSKHHEGFCLWPDPNNWNWNAVDIGPHRDLAGELVDLLVSRRHTASAGHRRRRQARPRTTEPVWAAASAPSSGP